MKRLFGTLAAALTSVLGAPVMAQANDGSDIVVEGQRLPSPKEIRQFARKIGSDLDLLRPIPRFNSPLCVGVAGVRDEHAEAFAARITENAREAGVPIAGQRCLPNAMVIFAEDTRKQITALRRQNPALFGEMTRHEFKEMISSRDAAFAWRVKEVVDLFGRSFERDMMADGLQGFPTNRTYEVGRLNPPIRIDTTSAVVVIERAQARGKTAEQLADYATMRLLAPTVEIKTIDETTPSSIMTLFISGDSRAPGGLTAFDKAYLASAYSIRVNGPSGMIFPETARLMTKAAASDDGR
ncbi:MAG: hypothetical protein ACXIUO_04020 [Erythrobacter sp.]